MSALLEKCATKCLTSVVVVCYNGAGKEIKKMGSNKTIVKGLRASQEFFDKCDLVAKAEGVDRNKLIVRVVSEYCDKKVKENDGN